MIDETHNLLINCISILSLRYKYKVPYHLHKPKFSHFRTLNKHTSMYLKQVKSRENDHLVIDTFQF